MVKLIGRCFFEEFIVIENLNMFREITSVIIKNMY